MLADPYKPTLSRAGFKTPRGWPWTGRLAGRGAASLVTSAFGASTRWGWPRPGPATQVLKPALESHALGEAKHTAASGRFRAATVSPRSPTQKYYSRDRPPLVSSGDASGPGCQRRRSRHRDGYAALRTQVPEGTELDHGGGD